MSKRKQKNANSLTLEEHFSELKKRLFISIGTLIVLFAVCLWKSNDILAMFLSQGKEAGYTMIALSPQEAFIQQLRASFVCGLMVAIPVLLYEIVVFVTPAIDKRNKRKFWISSVVGSLLFATGVLFAIYIVFPFVLNYMKGVTTASEISLEISVENYVSFLLTSIILIGLVFEMPIISLFLSGIGVISSESMKKRRKIAIVLILVIAAIITPPDVVSQIMIAVPMFILYEISILLCQIAEKKRSNNQDKDCEQETMEEQF